MRIYLRSKIHQARITEAELDYVGSLTIDEDLMDKADIHENEKVLISNKRNGARLETYVIKGPRGSGVLCANGAAAHLMQKGDEVIIMTFDVSPEPFTPTVLLVDENNNFVRYLVEKSSETA